MYFYFTVYPDVTSHCSFFHTFVPLTQTLQIFMEILKVSHAHGNLHVFMFSCSAADTWPRGDKIQGEVTHPTRFSTRV